MGGSIVAGREFTAAEVQGNARVAIVNERFAEQFGSPADALGHQVFREPRKIIGVVKGMDYRNEKNDPVDANPRQVFIPSTTPGGFFSTFVVRVNGGAEERLAIIRDAIQSADPRVPVFGAKTMEQRLKDALARPQFYRTAISCFAGFALVLAMIGVYGVVSYTVARRAHEMGVRMALGTTPGGLRLRLLCEGLLTICAGTVPGVAGAVLSGKLLESLVEGAKPGNAATYVGTILSIALISAVAIWAATRPLSRLDIVEVLRTD